MHMTTSRRNALLACSYALAVGGYFGLVVGLRISPNCFGHAGGWVYPVLILTLAVVLHSHRSLSGLVAWIAYLLCCLAYVLVAFGHNWQSMFKVAKDEVFAYTVVIVAFFVLSGFLAQGIGLVGKKFVLPPEEKTAKLSGMIMPWLPLAVLLVTALHVMGYYATYGDVHNQRSQYCREKEHLRERLLSCVAAGQSANVSQGDIVLTLGLPKLNFVRNEKPEVVVVFQNNGTTPASVELPRCLAQLLAVSEKGGGNVPFNEPPGWALADFGVGPLRLAPGERYGNLVSLTPWFSLKNGTTYRVHLIWKGKKSTPLEFTVQ
jgi:hypothetical protein